jgi:hypothetical protein
LLIGGSLLAGCAWRGVEPVRGSIKDSVAATTPAIGAPRARQPRAQNALADPNACHDVRSCEELLRVRVEGADRSWIGRPETPQALLTGVRMFAYRQLRPRMTCSELAAALRELSSVPSALQTPPAGSKPEDVTRALGLAAKVHDELRAERDARCKIAAPPPRQPEAQPPASQPQAAPPTPAQPPSSTQPQAPPAPAQPEK